MLLHRRKWNEGKKNNNNNKIVSSPLVTIEYSIVRRIVCVAYNIVVAIYFSAVTVYVTLNNDDRAKKNAVVQY